MFRKLTNKCSRHSDLKQMSIAAEKCFICGRDTKFLIDSNATLFREARCCHCDAKKRNSDTAHAIVSTFTDLKNTSLSESIRLLKGLEILECSSSGPIHRLLKDLPHYVYSEYFGGVPRGHFKGSIRCEDLENLTFAENSFDLVITEDILEHVADPRSALLEIRRVLKPGGYHIFTVPLHERRKTITRALMKYGKIKHIRPPVYHGDPICKEGALVYTDFGEDIVTSLNSMEMYANTVTYSKWYESEEIISVDSDDIFNCYMDYYKKDDLISFFKYNSSVIISQKPVFTGERFMPSLELPEISYEHWHRYLYAADLVKGKKVLDIACGDGYGSALLARHAMEVVGIDISSEAIRIASSKYARDNLEFRTGSAVRIPLKGSARFDIIVSYETIEHLAEEDQVLFLREIKRLIKPEGLFIISTPNKQFYSDIPDFHNEFHLKEFYVDEFKEFLNRFFKNVKFLGHKVYAVSYIWDMEDGKRSLAEYKIEYTEDGFRPTQQPKTALYIIALCSDSTINEPETSILVDISEKHSSDKEHELKTQMDGLKNSWSWRVTSPLRWLVDFFKGSL